MNNRTHMNKEEDELPLFEKVFAKLCSTMYRSIVPRVWYKTVMSSEWEAGILFAVYLVFRWYKNLQSLAVILLATAVLVSIKTTQTWNGHFLYRVHMWMQLAYTKEYSFTALDRSGFVLEFFSFMYIFSVPLIPISLIHSFVFLLCAMKVGKSDSISDENNIYWKKIGWTAYAVLRKFDPILRTFYSSGTQTSSFGKMVPENEESTFTAKTIHFCYLFSLVIVIVCGVYYILLLIPAFIFFSLCGRHIAVTAIVVLEAYTESKNIELNVIHSNKILSQEFYVLLGLLVPIYNIAFYMLQKKWVIVALEELKSDPNVTADWKRLANLFFIIPITEKQAGVRLFDNLHKDDVSNPERNTQLKVMLDEELNEHGRVKIMFVDTARIWDKKHRFTLSFV